jgi:hypothetical protein
MAKNIKSVTCKTLLPGSPRCSKVSGVATASAIAGGIAVAWWYRKTLRKLRTIEPGVQNSDFGISQEDSEEKF